MATYRASAEDLRLARAHGAFSTGWRERLGPGSQAACPCGCGLRGGVRARWWSADTGVLLRDGAAFALYFELLRWAGWLCLALGALMLPIWIQRLTCLDMASINQPAGPQAQRLSLAVVLGSASLAACDGQDGGDSCYLVEAAALLNAGVLAMVMVALPRARLALRQRLWDAGLPRAATAGAAASGQEPQRAVLLEGLPADAREVDVARFLASELQRMGARPQAAGQEEGDGVTDALTPQLPRPSAPPAAALEQEATPGALHAASALAEPPPLTPASPRVLLAPLDPRLAPKLERYLGCARELRQEEEEEQGPPEAGGPRSPSPPLGAPDGDAEFAPAGGGGRAAAELRDAEAALRRPRREFGDRGWDLRPAPVGLAVLRTPKEALLLAEALAPATLAKRVQQCCCPHWAPDAGLYTWMRGVRVVYPAPEPADVIWENVSHASDSLVCRRRLACAFLVLLYMAAVFGLLASIRRSIHSGLVTSLLTAVCTLLLQETVRRLIWRIDRPCASTQYHATVAVVTLAGCFVSGACVPVFVICAAEGVSWKEAWFRSDGAADFAAHALVTNATLAVLMDALIDTALPWLLSHVLRRPGSPCGRWFAVCLPKISSFRRLCEVHEGPEFYLGPNIGYAGFTIVFACCCTPVLPLAPFVVAIGVALWYAKEKWLLLELCRRPRLISPHVALRGPDILAYGLALVPAVAMLGLLPLCPAAYCTQTWWLTGQCTSWMRTDQAILRMGLEAAVFANAAVHGWYLGTQVALRLACCGRRGLAGRRGAGRCRRCWRGLRRLGCHSLRAVFWLAASLFLWLMAYWRGGKGLGEEVKLPFGTISLFTSSVRATLIVIYNLVVLGLVCIGSLGLLCRLVAGPSTVRAKLEEDENGLELLGAENRSGLFEEYVASSPFHAVLAREEEAEEEAHAAPSLEGLREWLRSPGYAAPPVAVRA